MDLRKVKPGDELTIPAEVWNGLLDMLAESRGTSKGRTPVAREQPASPARILVRNNSGAVVDRFRAVGLSAPTVLPSTNADEFRRRVVMDMVTPTASHKGAFAIVQQSLPVGGWGWAVVAGCTIAQITVTSSTDTFVDVAAGSTLLASGGTSGARILWKETGTGTKWAIVRMPEGGGATIAPLRVTSRKTGIGWYGVGAGTPLMTTSPSATLWGSNLAATGPITTPATENAIAYNCVEQGNTASYLLAVGQVVYGHLVGTSDAASGSLPIYAITHVGRADASFKVLTTVATSLTWDYVRAHS